MSYKTPNDPYAKKPSQPSGYPQSSQPYSQQQPVYHQPVGGQNQGQYVQPHNPQHRHSLPDLEQSGLRNSGVHATPPLDFEIIRQGYGITQPMRADIVEYFRQSHTQQEYKNPADFVKHKLDAKYGPFWFVFMWEDKKHLTAQYSYYNNDDRVFEFRAHGWQVLIYSFNQSVQKEPAEVHGQPQPDLQHHYPPGPPQRRSPQRYPTHSEEDLHYSRLSPHRPVYHPRSYWGPHAYHYDDHYDPYFYPHYPYPSLMHRPYGQSARWYY